MNSKDYLFPAKTEIEKKAAFYDNYNYNEFWKGRDYESESDNIAVLNFLKKTKTNNNCIIDVGGGLGRLVPIYIDLFKEAILLDPSIMQLEETKKRIGDKYPNLSFIRGISENIPLNNKSVDVIVCVRVSHHIPKIENTFLEYNRILSSGGYLIFDVANKIHLKARLKTFFNKQKRKELFNKEINEVNSKNKEVPFVNHNPKEIIKDLEKLDFEIIKIRSVSNLRSGFLKKILPFKILVFIESCLQKQIGRAHV